MHPLWDSLVRRRAKSAIYRAAGFEREKNGFCSERKKGANPSYFIAFATGKKTSMRTWLQKR